MITPLPLTLSPIPDPPVICARTSDALGPVYVNTPVVALYAKEPSPPASAALIYPLISCLKLALNSEESMLSVLVALL